MTVEVGWEKQRLLPNEDGVIRLKGLRVKHGTIMNIPIHNPYATPLKYDVWLVSKAIR